MMQKILSNISEMENNEEREYGYFLFEKEEGEYKVELEERYVYIPELDIRIHYGYSMHYNNETNEYDELSHDIYVFFDINKNEVVYQEGGSSLDACISNYLWYKKNIKLSPEDAEKLKCEIKYI